MAEPLKLDEGGRLECSPNGMLDGCERILNRSDESRISGKVDNVCNVSCHNTLPHTQR